MLRRRDRTPRAARRAHLPAGRRDLTAETRVPALVTGFGNVTLGAIRALGRKGIPTYVGSPRASFEAASRWYRPVPATWGSGSLAHNLRRCGLERAVLIPTSDGAAIEAAELPPELAERFPISAPRGELLRTMVDKQGLADLLERHDVPRPRTWRIDSAAELDALPDDVLEAGFLKPRDSLRFTATFNRKSLRPSGRAAIVAAWSEMAERGFEMVLQEYIPGPPTNCYLIDGHVDRDGRVGGLFARQRLRQYPLDFGNSSALRSVPLDEVAGARRILLDFLADIGYRGIFNAEFKRDARDGSFVLFEVNPRAWWYVEFAARCGVDAVTMAYEDALGLPVTPATSYDVGRTVIYPYFDLNALLALRRLGESDLASMARSWIGAEQMIYAPDDPRPFFVATLRLAREYLARRLPY